MAALIEFVNFIKLNKANLVTNYTRLLIENRENCQTFQPTGHQISAQTLLETVVEACETQSTGLLSLLFDHRAATSSQPAPQKNIELSLFLFELECLDQTLIPVVTNLEAGKFLWQMLSEARATILCLIESSSAPLSTLSTAPAAAIDNNEETRHPDTSEPGQDNVRRYYSLFEDSPMSLWEEDFSAVKNEIERLKSEGVTDFRAYFDTHPEAIAEHARLVKIIDVNQATLALYQAGSKEEFYTGLGQVFTEESLDAFKEELIAIAEGETKLKTEAVNNTLDGQTKSLELTWAVPPGYEATLSKVFVSIVDITDRKMIEAALRDSEVRYRSLFEDSPIPLWEEDFSAVKAYLNQLRREGITDFRAYFDEHPEAVAQCIATVKIIDVNRATLALFEAKSSEEFFAGLDQIFSEESNEAFKEELIAFAEGQTRFEQEVVNYTLTGLKKNIVLQATVAPNAEETLSQVLVTMVDITERKLLDQQIRESLAYRTRQVKTSTQVAQAIATAPALDELFSRVVHLVQEEFGYYHAHVYTLEQDYLVMQEGTGEVGRQLKAENHRIALATEHSLVARAARSGEPILISDVSQEPTWMPNPLLPATKSELAVPIKLDLEVLGVLDVQDDAVAGLNEEDQLLLMGLCGQIAVAIEHRRAETERQQAEDALRESEARLAEALAVAQLGHWELDIVSQVFTFTDQFYGLLGTTAAQEGGYQMPAAHYAEKFIPPDDMHLVVEETKMAIETTDPNYQSQLEHQIIRADGTEGYLQVRIKVVKDGHGQTVKTYGVNQDITERKQAELERERLLAEAERRVRREQTIREITERMQTAPSLESLVKIAAEELGQRLSAGHALVELGFELEEQGAPL